MILAHGELTASKVLIFARLTPHLFRFQLSRRKSLLETIKALTDLPVLVQIIAQAVDIPAIRGAEQLHFLIDIFELFS